MGGLSKTRLNLTHFYSWVERSCQVESAKMLNFGKSDVHIRSSAV